MRAERDALADNNYFYSHNPWYVVFTIIVIVCCDASSCPQGGVVVLFVSRSKVFIPRHGIRTRYTHKHMWTCVCIYACMYVCD